MRDNYLIHGTNALKGSLRYVNWDEFLYEPRSVEIYLSVACKTLSYLAEDQESLQKISDGMNRRPNEIYEQFEDFIEEFVKPDQALLMAAGMDEKMGQYLFKDLAAMQRMMERDSSVNNLNKQMNPKLLKQKIKELQHSVCNDKHSLVVGRSPLWRAIRVIGGGAIVTTNVAADAIIGGLASAYSTTFGGYLVGQGIDG